MTIVSPPIAKILGPAIIGHRGARATHPENTAAAFKEAFRAGAQGVELDVIPTRDRILAVIHDFTTPDGLDVPTAGFAQLIGVPRLEEVLEIEGGVFDIEMKRVHGLGSSRPSMRACS